MSTATILVIDDSTTIRKMVDSHLSQEGYRVVLAPNGEEGLEKAVELKPDLILLDHQLPGTLGIDVCRKIISQPGCEGLPFVVSSTLRKQAYVEYMDVPNVVDSLPKPFKPELLKMTVANALEMGDLIVSSQANGTAVPEVIGENADAAMTGDFTWLGLRELLDFLNNGSKSGLLEVESPQNRISFFLQNGRIQGVTSASFDPEKVTAVLPDSMKELAPLMQFTMSCGSSSRVDGLVELLDRKVLDPRMLRTFLRHQAAVLTRYCFDSELKSFSFLPDRNAPGLINKAPLDCCLAALLVESLVANPVEDESSAGWVRTTFAGHNMDRTGLSARHVQLLSAVDTTPRSTAQLAEKAAIAPEEAFSALHGFLKADWVIRSEVTESKTLVVFEPETVAANQLRCLIENPGVNWTGNVVRDTFSLQLLLKRKTPDAVLVALEGEEEYTLPEGCRLQTLQNLDAVIGLIVPEGDGTLHSDLEAFRTIHRPYTQEQILAIVEGRDCTQDSAEPESHDEPVADAPSPEPFDTEEPAETASCQL